MNTRTQTQKIKPKITNSKLNPLNQLPFPLLRAICGKPSEKKSPMMRATRN